MTVREYVRDVSPERCKIVLIEILDRYLEPAFGSLTKKEVDLLMIDALEDLDYISLDPSIYEIERKLRITRAKARGLIYENELRQSDPADLDKRIKDILKKPHLLKKDENLFSMEIENPFVKDRFQEVAHTLDYVTNEELNPSLVTLSVDGLAAIIDHYMTEEERKNARKELVAAGAPDTSLPGVLKSVLKAVAFKYAQESGEILVDKAGTYLSPILSGAVDMVAGSFKELFASKKGEKKHPRRNGN